jgi:hypothetical protein
MQKLVPARWLCSNVSGIRLGRHDCLTLQIIWATQCKAQPLQVNWTEQAIRPTRQSYF